MHCFHMLRICFTSKYYCFAVSSFTKGEHMIPVLNECGTHCAVFGNHDFGKISHSVFISLFVYIVLCVHIFLQLIAFRPFYQYDSFIMYNPFKNVYFELGKLDDIVLVRLQTENCNLVILNYSCYRVYQFFVLCMFS